MTIKKRPMAADGSTLERRRSRRFPVAIPIEVSWSGKGGDTVTADAYAREVNANGGYLKMSDYPDVGSRVSLTNFMSAQTVEARVLAAPHTREGVANGVVVEMIVPNEAFWGVNLQVEKTGAELQKLEKAMQSEGIDLRLLKEYRDAVEYIRSAAGIVQQLRERQVRGLDDSELQAQLSTKRIQRAISACWEVAADIDGGRVKSESKEVDELYQALEEVGDRLRRNCHPRSNRVQSEVRPRERVTTLQIARGGR